MELTLSPGSPEYLFVTQETWFFFSLKTLSIFFVAMFPGMMTRLLQITKFKADLFFILY